ncbi:Autophagy-related protein 18h [Spatholobus suberectus]|nr:Autophagy-related protein 18h [Spatholobus suberectus]
MTSLTCDHEEGEYQEQRIHPFIVQLHIFLPNTATSSVRSHLKDQLLWACFNRLEFAPSFKHVLLLGYSNGFQVLDVEDASNVLELASKHDELMIQFQFYRCSPSLKDLRVMKDLGHHTL